MIWIKKYFFEKNAFFDPYLGHFAHKTGPNGAARGVPNANLGFLRVPDPLGGL